MRPLRLLVLTPLALVACGPAPAPTTAVTPSKNSAPIATTNPVCPEQLWFYSWKRELFPGCPPGPFHWVGTVCNGSSCPMPCRDVSSDRARTDLVASRHMYEKGRWVSSERDWSVGKRLGEYLLAEELPPSGRYCKRVGHHGTCDAMKIVDGVEQRITEAEIEYNNQGDPISLLERGDDRPTTYQWAAGHQLVLERVPRPGNSSTEFRYEYDAHGRLLRIVSSGWGDTEDAHYHYNERGLVSHVVIDHSTGSRFTFTFDYDAQDRPIRSEWLDEHKGLDPMKEEKKYEYACPAPRPFAETLPIMERFRDQACACTDHACSERVIAELTRWRSGVADAVTYKNEPDLDAGKKFQQLDNEIERCAR